VWIAGYLAQGHKEDPSGGTITRTTFEITGAQSARRDRKRKCGMSAEERG